ncbi:hypothetical protein A359_09600 [secondary endosymbiont of Ctenarytaina eucalypti]|uniref:Uncharacterized protein n=1 Tax=secondary endosymbiont of Ctenarytaina eucalypti TaxID=1199245 RepID=J3VTL3_9ENTR|nr:hypothetical protein A359_09600 [secondary endosymbiont of Ctenarytaina eucalypti]
MLLGNVSSKDLSSRCTKFLYGLFDAFKLYRSIVSIKQDHTIRVLNTTIYI